MKRNIIFLFFILSSVSAKSASSTFGAGIVLGDPSAISGKYWLESKRAIDMGLGWDSGSNLLVFADYLFHYPEWLANVGHGAKLMPYIGLGGLIKLYSDENDKRRSNDDNSMRLVFRVPVGIEWLPREFPVGLFAELVPGLRIYPNTSTDIGAGIGARFYF
ncbi:MAG: hypothetical protein SGJ18_03190 [Pseudomonadota bacterium]|nr:hypothetical protein [Pseudomonadota bacterium]